MITSISLKPHPYVLEADRTNVEDRTIFHIIPKTVRGASETAADYARVQREHRRKGIKEIDVKAMQLADDKEWLRAIQRVQNYGVTPNCPGPADDASGYDHFLVKSEKEPAKYVKKKDGIIVITDTSDEADLKYIFWSMSVEDTEEIMKAYLDYNVLKEGAKNV